MDNKFDATIEGSGSIFMLTPVSESGQDWTGENLSEDVLMLENSIAVEHGYIEAIAYAMLEDGLTVSLNGNGIEIMNPDQEAKNMDATTVIAYTYEADTHCIDCTRERFEDPDDEYARDKDGNPIRPVFCGAEVEYWPVPCGSCFCDLDGFVWIDKRR